MKTKNQSLKKQTSIFQAKNLVELLPSLGTIYFLCLLVGILIEYCLNPSDGFGKVGYFTVARKLPTLTNSIFWTSLSFVPIFVGIFGFSTWRNICPLAFLSKLSGHFSFMEKKNLNDSVMERYFWYFQAFAFGTSLYVRLMFSNASLLALFLNLLFLIAAACAVGFYYTGKSWCNFFCPMAPVERLFERGTTLGTKVSPVSKCEPCSNCKLSCPDINYKISYARELKNPGSRFFFYAYPGLVLGFFGWFYLHTGSWDYYISSDWMLDNQVLVNSMNAGFFFWQACPKFIAVFLTLIFASGSSFFLFKAIERLLKYFQRTPKTALDLHRRMDLLHGQSARVGIGLFLLFVCLPLGGNLFNSICLFSLFSIVILTFRILFSSEEI